MSTDYADIMHDEYIKDMHVGYADALAQVAHSKNMGELSKNLGKLREYMDNFDELRGDTSSMKGMQETATAVSTLSTLVSKNRSQFWGSIVLSFILGLLVNYISSLMFG